MDETRRNLLMAGAIAVGAQALRPAWAGSAADADEDLAVPDRPANPSPGQAGQFDFLQGRWQIHNRRLRAGTEEWEEFEGTATCWSILGGVVSIEELRIPSRNFSGMGLRTLDVGKRQWSDYWVNSTSGVVGTAGMLGSFEDGKALFYSEERDGDATVLAASLWDQIEARHCRWRQAVSRDGGRTWAHNWIMHWRKL